MRHLLSSRLSRVCFVACVWVCLVVLVLAGVSVSRAAKEFNYAIHLNYKLQDDGWTEVVSTYKVTNSTANRILASLKVNTPVADVSDVTATYADGSNLPVTMTKRSSGSQGYQYDYQELNLAFRGWPTGRGATQEFTLRYKTQALIDAKGSSKTFLVPGLSDIQADESYTISVTAPQAYGKLYSTGALPDIDGADGDRLRYVFANANDLKRSISLIFGDTTVYKVDFAYPLKNNTAREQTFTITLPPDTSSQKIFVNKLDPAPVSTKLDADGNIIAEYRVPAHTTRIVHTDISARVKYLEYDLSKGGAKADIPADMTKAYLASTQYWQTNDTNLVAKAKAAVGDTTNVVEIVRSLQQLTIDTLTYNNEKIKYNIRQGSSKALQNPQNAVCLEYSDLMIALLRSQGIPARMPVGYAYAGSLKQSKAVVDSLHSWVEAYVPGIGWINVDPTWGEKYDSFGKSDLDHLTFALWGRRDALPSAVMMGDVDQNYQYEDTTISYVESAPEVLPQGTLIAHKYALFPGVSMVRYEAHAPQQVAGDEYTVSLKQGSRRTSDNLGSLAPGQAMTETHIYFGGDWMTPLDLLFTQQADGQTRLLAAQTTPVTYWPLAVSTLLLAGAFTLITVQLVIRRKRAQAAFEAGRTQAQNKAQAIERAMHGETPLPRLANEISHDTESKNP